MLLKRKADAKKFENPKPERNLLNMNLLKGILESEDDIKKLYKFSKTLK